MYVYKKHVHINYMYFASIQRKHAISPHLMYQLITVNDLAAFGGAFIA